jgi:hypothetical protein
VYYHGTGYRGKCPDPYTREETLQQQFTHALREFVIPPTILQWLEGKLVTSDQTEQAAREQALRRQQAEVERLQARLDVLYEDRLDGRIDAGVYDQKAAAIREMLSAQAATLPLASQAVDLIALNQ